MNDRLQRRLADADPLAAGTGQLPDPARLDAIKEHIMQTDANGPAPEPSDHRPAPRRRLRPRALGLTALTASGLAAVLVVATLVRPTTAALAWDPSPTAATPAQEAAATAACTLPAGDPNAPVSDQGVTSGGGAIPVTGSENGVSGVAVSGGDTVVSGGDTVVSGGDTVVSASGPVPDLPQLPTELPPLVYLELHGTGAVAVFADDETTAYCLLVAKGDGFEMAGIQVPLKDGGVVAIGVGAGSVGVTNGPTQGGPVSVSGSTSAMTGDLATSVMVVDYGDTKVGIVAGEAPEGATTVKVEGGAADGATATVHDGRFALWTPDVLDATSTVIALDANGAEVGRQVLGVPPALPK